jgi:hypothetical protein
MLELVFEEEGSGGDTTGASAFAAAAAAAAAAAITTAAVSAFSNVLSDTSGVSLSARNVALSAAITSASGPAAPAAVGGGEVESIEERKTERCHSDWMMTFKKQL